MFINTNDTVTKISINARGECVHLKADKTGSVRVDLDSPEWKSLEELPLVVNFEPRNSGSIETMMRFVAPEKMPSEEYERLNSWISSDDKTGLLGYSPDDYAPAYLWCAFNFEASAHAKVLDYAKAVVSSGGHHELSMSANVTLGDFNRMYINEFIAGNFFLAVIFSDLTITPVKVH